MTQPTNHADNCPSHGERFAVPELQCCTACSGELQPVAQPRVALAPEGDRLAQLLSETSQLLPELWRQVIDTMSEGLLLVSPDRRVLYINQRAEQLIGRSLAEVRGLSCTDAINCPQCKCTCRLFEEGGVEAVDVTVFPLGDPRPRALRKNARLLRDASGNILGGVETFSDITAEAAQRCDNERYAAMLFKEKTRVDALLRAIDDGVCAIDAAQRVVSCSAQFASMLGLRDAAAAVGRELTELFAVAPGFFGRSYDADGRTFAVELGRDDEKTAATLSFRRVRLSDDEMLGVLRRKEEIPRSSGYSGDKDHFHGIVSRSPRMWELFRVLECVAQNQASVLIEGESGVGKELVAQAIHRLGPRCNEPFYAVNCATFTGGLLLSELFGHERGSFTGAFRTTTGKLEMAGNGTLFLDEVSEIPLQYQAALLRVLESRQFERVGGSKRIDMNARIIAATNRRLSDAVQAKQFRSDLYFRLKVIPIQVPPLRERGEDIPLLASHFASHAAVNPGGKPLGFTDAAMDALKRYAWPGNVRELRNMVEYLCFVSTNTIDLEHLPPEIREEQAMPHVDSSLPSSVPLTSPPSDGRAQLLEALQRTQFRKQEAANLLGIDRTTLWRKMKRFGI